MLTARLHPRWVGGNAGYRHSVIFDGELLVDRSRDPEFDAARALLAKGITGKLIMLEGKTGRPRTIINIEKAAKVTVKEGPLRFENVSIPDRAPSPEEPSLGRGGSLTRYALPRPCTHKSSLVSSGWSMSALPPEADIRQRIEHVCFVP